VPQLESVTDVITSRLAEKDGSQSMFVITTKAIHQMALDQETLRPIKKQEKESSLKSKVISLLPNAIILADQI
jgi:hypothetical protein